MSQPVTLRKVEVLLNRLDVTKYFATTQESHNNLQRKRLPRFVQKKRDGNGSEDKTPISHSEAASIAISIKADKDKLDNQIKRTQACSDAGFYCEPCTRSFKTKTALQVHSRRHEFHCTPCNRNFASNRALRLHSRFHNLVRKSYACPHCGKDCTCNPLLEKHIRRYHSDHGFTTEELNKMSCAQCGKLCGSQELLDRHVQSKHVSKTCKFCSKVFRCKTELEIHMAVHTKEKFFQCQLCKKSFATLQRLKTHFRAHSDNDFKCEPCSLSFPRQYHFADHLLDVHKSEASTPSHMLRVAAKNTQNMIKKSRLFGIKYTEAQLMITQPGKCPHCDKVFKYRSELRIHMVAHTGEKPYQCPKCDKSFAYQPGLINHFKKHAENGISCELFEHSSPIAHIGKKKIQAKHPPVPPQVTSLTTPTRSQRGKQKNLKQDSTMPGSGFQESSPAASPPEIPPNKPVRIPHPRNCIIQQKSIPVCAENSSPKILEPEQPKETSKLIEFTCPYCARIFDTEYLLLNHIVVHARENRYQCRICLEAFRWPILQLHDHVKANHIGISKSAKNQVESVEVLGSGLGSTGGVQVSKGSSLIVNDHTRPKSSNNKFQCTQCDVEVSFSEISGHMQSHLTES